MGRKDEENKPKDTGLDEKQQESVKKYLASRFGQFGLLWWKLEYKHKSASSAEFTQDLLVNANSLGIFAHALSKCTFVAKVCINTDETRLPEISVSLNYEHIGGSTNGCRLDCSVYVHKDGDVFEVYNRR